MTDFLLFIIAVFLYIILEFQDFFYKILIVFLEVLISSELKIKKKNKALPEEKGIKTLRKRKKN